MVGKRLVSKQQVILSGVALLAFLLYAVGVKFVLLPVLVAISMRWLPMPRIVTSWFSRAVIAILLTMTLLQFAASVAFLLFPKRGFVVLAAILLIVHICMWICAPRRRPQKLSFISANDICGFVVVLCFLLPFGRMLTGQSTIQRIAEIGSLQAIDATNHYAAIAELTQDQHLNYAKDYYTYPKGFHIAVGFTQNTFFSSQYGLGWEGNALLYFGDYLLYGALLGYVLYLLCSSWLSALSDKFSITGWTWSKLLVAACMAPPLILLYLLPLVSEGFLSYYYVCITLITGLLFLSELRLSVKTAHDSLDLGVDAYGRWNLIAYVLLLFGATATWPLLMPPFAIIGALFLIPGHSPWKIFAKRIITPGLIPVAIAYATLLLPIYFQLKYSNGTAQDLNLTGGLTQFHSYVLALGLIVTLLLVMNRKIEESFRRMILNIFFPLFGFTVILMIFQYFTIGEIRYYVIKVSLLMEMLLLALEVAVLIWVFVSSRLYEARTAWLLPVIPMFALILLIGSIDNPLKDTRDLFRHASQDTIPQYLDQDVAANVRLGEAGKIKNFNLTELHYNAAQGKFFADMQVPYWADMMQYTGNAQDHVAETCIGNIYNNLAFGSYDAAAQRSLKQELIACATAAQRRGEPFYVVTDAASLPHVRQLLGNRAIIVVD
jgi:hypothetical protein